MTVPPRDFLRRSEWLAAVLITVIIAGLHFFFLFHAGGLWRDEVNLINLASRHSVSDMAKDSFPVLMPLLVKGWAAIGFGQSDFGLRFFGTLVGLGIGTVLWLSALATRRPPLFSLTLFGLNAAVIIYGDSLRGFGLGCLLIMLANVAMVAFLKNPSWPRAAILTASAILSVQVLYQNAVLLAAICLGGWCVCWRWKNFPAAAKIFVAAIAAAISLLPYWHHVAGLSDSNDSLRVGFTPFIAFVKLNQLAAYPLPFFTYVWGLLAYIVIAFNLMALRAHFSKPQMLPEKSPADFLPVFTAVTMAAALVGFTAFLWLAERQTEPWYFLPLAAIMAMCFDLGIPAVSLRRWIRMSILAAVVAAAFTEIALAQRNLNLRFTNVDELARQLNGRAAAQDFVLVTPWFCGISFERYCPSNLIWQTIPPMADHSVHRYDQVFEKMKTPAALEPLFQKITATLQSGHRVWVISSTTNHEWAIPKDSPLSPPALPPPPLPGTGWSTWPYSVNWAAQTAWFLEHNSVEFADTAAVATTNVNRYEALSLFMASGWKIPPTNSPALPSR